MVFAVLALAGCKASQPPEKPAPQPSVATVVASAAAPSVTATANSSSVTGSSIAEKTPLYEFDYAYPAAAAATPALKAWLDADLAKRKADLIGQAKEAQDDAKKNGFDYHAYAHSTEWKVVTDLPGWLSLSAERWDYTGGAHGNSWAEGLLWDKAAGAPRKALDLFTSKQALSAAIRAPFCTALDKQRVEKRGEPVDPNSGDEFDKCIDPVDSILLLGSSDKQHFTRIGVLVNPYEAGPYVEGFYEVTLPVTPQVLKAVKPEYRALFALGR
ncbi:MAG: DUF3298 and DUF4163 domain-containing protein [Proteobacteria bacterium]|nr:DUF3298 and DUF4163 domain-containing protein [Pseudomonadota bacterium]